MSIYDEDEDPIKSEVEIELKPYVFAKFFNDNGKLRIWKKGFGDLANSDYLDTRDKDELIEHAKKKYNELAGAGKFTEHLVDDPKNILELPLEENATVARFESFLESVKQYNPALVEAVHAGFKAIMELYDANRQFHMDGRETINDELVHLM